MSKVSSYLQHHLLGEVLTRSDVREKYSRDSGVLREKPDMVIMPRTVNDVRKTLRFSTQLAEKGHTLPVSTYGYGTAAGGGALSGGVTLDLSTHLNNVLEYDAKQRLVRAQAGASSEGVVNALRLHGATIASFEYSQPATVGGWIGEGVGHGYEHNYRSVVSAVSRLEVVLAGGEVIQTGPLSKRDLSKKKGLQGAEGDLYRGMDAILEDYADVIDDLKRSPYPDMSGYPGIIDVAGKGGSFDLTPLFVGSQGSLGVIVETILKTEFRPGHLVYAVLSFADGNAARDTLDSLRKLSPSFIEYIDSRIIDIAIKQEVNFEWHEAALSELNQLSHVIVVGWKGFNDRALQRSLKKTRKLIQKIPCSLYVSANDDMLETLEVLRDVTEYTRRPTGTTTHAAHDIIGGFYISPERFEDFSSAIDELGTSLHIDLPLYGSGLANVYTVLPSLSLQKVSDKQKLFKIVDKLIPLVEKFDGVYYARGGEGKLTAHFADSHLDKKQRELAQAIKDVFDPSGILSSGTKRGSDLKNLISKVRSDDTLSR